MRVLLRDRSRNLFLGLANFWTADIAEAQVFKHSAAAMDQARSLNLKTAEVILDFGTPVDSVILPVPGPFRLDTLAPLVEPNSPDSIGSRLSPSS